MTKKQKFALDNFNFFHSKIIEELPEFQEIVTKKVKTASASELAKGKIWREEHEEAAYKTVSLLFRRLLDEYNTVITSNSGWVPDAVSEKLPTLHMVGELMSRYDAIRRFHEGKIDDDEDFNEDFF